jgi:hypothetical protein
VLRVPYLKVQDVQVAIKFFIDANAFRCEEAASSVPELRKNMHALVLMEPAQKVRQQLFLVLLEDSHWYSTCMVFSCFYRKDCSTWYTLLRGEVLYTVH